MNPENQSNQRAPWNKGKLIGQKSPLKLAHWERSYNFTTYKQNLIQMTTFCSPKTHQNNQAFEKLFQETVLRDENAIFWAAT